MDLHIRPTTRDDLSAVDALLSRSYPRLLKDAYPPSVLVTALPLISRAQPHLVASGTYYAVVLDGRIVGAGGWSADRVHRDLGHVRHVATDDRVTRRGVGRALLNYILQSARSGGMRRMECWSTRNAVPFYASVGFSEVGLMDVELQPGITFPSVRMRMDLASRSGDG